MSKCKKVEEKIGCVYCSYQSVESVVIEMQKMQDDAFQRGFFDCALRIEENYGDRELVMYASRPETDKEIADRTSREKETRRKQYEALKKEFGGG